MQVIFVGHAWFLSICSQLGSMEFALYRLQRARLVATQVKRHIFGQHLAQIRGHDDLGDEPRLSASLGFISSRS